MARHEQHRTPPCGGLGLLGLPREVLLQVLAFLRAWDLAALGMTARAFMQPQGAIEEVSLGIGVWILMVVRRGGWK